MVRVHIIYEGQTEVKFVKAFLETARAFRRSKG